jgi:Family of unknown function (DUF6464)
MALDNPLTELVVSHSQSVLGYLDLPVTLQTGTHLEFGGQSYLILERKHQYQLRSGRYQLSKVMLSVQTLEQATDGHLVDGRWMIGDITCRYNARSELLRCAVNPGGPCDRCVHYRQFTESPIPR